MPSVPQAELDVIEQWYASVVTQPAIYRDNPPLAALAIIQQAQAERERRIADAWTTAIWRQQCLS